MTRLNLRVATLAMAAFTSFPALAQDSPVVIYGTEQPTAIVSYADLDLRRSADVDVLNARVDRAAGRLCDTDDLSIISVERAEQRCAREAIAGAQPQIQRALAGLDNRQLAGSRALRVTARR